MASLTINEIVKLSTELHITITRRDHWDCVRMCGGVRVRGDVTQGQLVFRVTGLSPYVPACILEAFREANRS